MREKIKMGLEGEQRELDNIEGSRGHGGRGD